MELKKRKETRAGWRWVGVRGWHRPWLIAVPQSSRASHGGLLGEDCAVPIPGGLLQLPLVCASAGGCAGSPEVTGDTI